PSSRATSAVSPRSSGTRSTASCSRAATARISRAASSGSRRNPSGSPATARPAPPSARSRTTAARSRRSTRRPGPDRDGPASRAPDRADGTARGRRRAGAAPSGRDLDRARGAVLAASAARTYDPCARRMFGTRRELIERLEAIEQRLERLEEALASLGAEAALREQVERQKRPLDALGQQGPHGVDPLHHAPRPLREVQGRRG